MDAAWLEETVSLMRQIGNDLQQCEVKEAKGGVPDSLVETLSAFSNGDGGYIILGLSERRGFAPVDGFDARSMQDAVSSMCEKLTPTVRPFMAVLPFEGSQVLCARISEMHPRDKPCYVTARGCYAGSFIRTGDGDRRMSSYEVDRLLEEHRQPLYDDEVVLEADMNDLDSALVEGFVRRQRELHPRIMGSLEDEDILLDLHVAKKIDADADGPLLRPTLAGLVAMGRYPQKFFPRLNVTFTAFPGTTKVERVDENRRFLDAQTLVGSIPAMMEDAIAAVVRNSRTGAVIEGAFRKDAPDYPRSAIREAIANALMHRDYSPESRGSQVQVNLYADRLEILNPGGLYGDVTVDTLGRSGVSSSRNQFLSNILEATPYSDGGYVVENRGTGYQEIEYQLRKAMMLPPRPKNSLVAFSLTIDKRRRAESEMRSARGEEVATAILSYLKDHSSASTRELAEESGLSRSAITAHVRKLVNSGEIEPMEPARSPKQRYRLAR